MATNENALIKYFPLVQWLWAGIFCVLTGIGFSLYSLKLENTETRSDINKLKADLSNQEKRVDEQVKILNSIHSEQVKLNESIKNLNQNLVTSIQHTNDRVEYALKRIDGMKD